MKSAKPRLSLNSEVATALYQGAASAAPKKSMLEGL
jgi:hypothetical protein